MKGDETMGKRVGGIILLVLGVMALFGGIVNGSLAQIFSGEGNPISNATTLIVMAALIIGGIVMIVKGKNNKLKQALCCVHGAFCRFIMLTKRMIKMKYYIYKSENKVDSFIPEKKKKQKASVSVAINTPIYVGASFDLNADDFETKLQKIHSELTDREKIGTIYDDLEFCEGTIKAVPFYISRESEYVFAIDTSTVDKSLFVTVLLGSKRNMTNGYMMENISDMYSTDNRELSYKRDCFIDDIMAISQLDLGKKYTIEFFGESLDKPKKYERDNNTAHLFDNIDDSYKYIILKVITPYYMRIVREM